MLQSCRFAQAYLLPPNMLGLPLRPPIEPPMALKGPMKGKLNPLLPPGPPLVWPMRIFACLKVQKVFLLSTNYLGQGRYRLTQAVFADKRLQLRAEALLTQT